MKKEVIKKKSVNLASWQKKFSGIQVSNIDQIIKAKKPSIARVKKDHGDAVVKALLVLEIENLINFLNLGKSMNAMQVTETINIIQRNYYYLTLQDFRLFFDRLKSGYYGQFYDRLDGSIIMLNLKYYDEERMSAFEVNSTNKAQRHKKDKNDPTIDEIRKVVVEVVNNKPKEKKDVQEKKKLKTNMAAQRWMKQFDNLFLKYGESKGIRTIIINGSRMTVNQFLEKKIKNMNTERAKEIFKKSKASSQVEFAQMVDETPSNINAVLNGKRNASDKKLDEWEEAINLYY